MRRLSRFALVAACAAVLAGSAACSGGSDAATVTQAPAASSRTAPAAAAAATATATAPAAPQTTGASPAATAAQQLPEATPAPPTPAPAQPTPAPAPTQAPPPPSEQSITIIARDVKFSPSSLSVTAGSVVHVLLDNQDAGVAHDIIFYDASGARVAATDPSAGPVQQALTFTVGAAQRYVFKCSVHPQAMIGTLSVQ